ncbi:hypothetical protein HN51_009362, partial [Arachis hypogaea]
MVSRQLRRRSSDDPRRGVEKRQRPTVKSKEAATKRARTEKRRRQQQPRTDLSFWRREEKSRMKGEMVMVALIGFRRLGESWVVEGVFVRERKGISQHWVFVFSLESKRRCFDCWISEPGLEKTRTVRSVCRL